MTNPKLRRGRHSEIGAYYAVTAISAARAPLFADPQFARAVADEIASAERTGRTGSHAWMIMPDRVHWWFELHSGTLARHMQAFKSRSAITINRLRGVSAPVWQGDYYDHCLRGSEDLLMQVRYVVANPLRKGLVERIEQYPYWACAWAAKQEDFFL
jgi:REP element-mobilizing transposase RayT